jgi:hypothetical protein
LELQSATLVYLQIYAEMFKEYQRLQTEQKKMPLKFSPKNKDNENYEDHLLTAARHKHEAIELFRTTSATSDAIRADIDHISAHIELYEAKEALELMGWDKVTEGLRETFVKANTELHKLLKVKGDLKALFESAEFLVKAFEGDETNCRRLLERQNKLTGLL